MKRVACGLLFAASVTAQTRCSIRGIVVDALNGQPIARAQVFAGLDSDADDDNAPPPVRQVSDTHGFFCFENLAEGDYVVAAKRARYIDASYGEHWPGGAGQILEVVAGESVAPITIRITPQAVIASVLLDGDGDPVQGGRIDLQKPHWKAGRLKAESVQQTTTDDQGRYRFAGLVPGAYFISTIPARGGVSPVSRMFLDQNGHPFRQVEGKTYYKDSISFRDATPIRVEAGQEISDLELTLRKTEARRVSGQAAPEILNTTSRTLYLFQQDNGFWLNVSIQDDGRFLVDGLSPDHYVLQGPGIAKKEINVTNGDIDGVILEPNDPIELQITVHLDGTHSLIPSLPLVDKTPNSIEFGQSRNAELVSENKFKLVVLPGQYEIGLVNDSAPYFFKGLTIDGEPQSRPILDLKGGGRKAIELFLSSDVASVAGRVILGESLEEEITLLLEDEADPGFSVTKLANADGKFQWNLPQPGRYRLYAFEQFNRDWWGNPELTALFAGKSVVLDAKEGRHLHVTVPLISTQDFQEALRKTAF